MSKSEFTVKLDIDTKEYSEKMSQLNNLLGQVVEIISSLSQAKPITKEKS